MYEQLKPGDVVHMQSENQKMTVRQVTDEEVVCEWLVGGELRSHSFIASSLEKISHKPRFPVVFPVVIGSRGRV